MAGPRLRAAGIFALLLLPASGLFSLREAGGGLERPRIALVLSGGGARGAAHVGVLKVLEECRVPIDLVVGTSMGAIVGGMYASGMSPERMASLLNSIDWQDLFSDRPPAKLQSFRHKHLQQGLASFEMGFNRGRLQTPKGIVTGQKLGFLLKSLTLRSIESDNFDQLPLAFRAVATDMESGAAAVLKRGNLAEAMGASMAIPGVFPPVELNGRLYADGGLVNNLPIDVARALGADIIIAVDVASHLYSPKQLKSLLEITRQIIDISTLEKTRRQLELLSERDLLIAVDLGDISPADFRLAPRIIGLGEKAARALASRLDRYAASPEVYRKFLLHQRREEGKPLPIDAVRINRPLRVHPRRLQARLRLQAGASLDTRALSQDLMRIYSLGDFERVDFKIVAEDGLRSLVVDTKEKSWGPNYLRFGLNISDNFQGDGTYTLHLQYSLTQLDALGAEWVTEAQLGRTLGASSHLYQPLDFANLFFLSPSLRAQQEVTDIYSGNRRTAQYRLSILEAAIDLGANLGSFAEARLGVSRAWGTAGPLVGGEELQEFTIRRAALSPALTFDSIGNDNFPAQGFYARASLQLARPWLGAELTYDKLEFRSLKPFGFGPHTVLLSAAGGGRLRGGIPFYDQFLLGGFQRLSGCRPGELRGQYYGLGSLIYSFRLTRLNELWSSAVYLGASIETGSVWEEPEEIGAEHLRLGGSLYAAMDTPLGPLYLGFGLAERIADAKVYLFLGRPGGW